MASAEFPLLKQYGLKATNITGDGNCLFNALSDQIHGDESLNMEIRLKVIEEMRNNPNEYKPFISVNQGGGQRRNPKRKNVAAPKSAAIPSLPTDAQVDVAWERHLKTMSQSGCYGDNMEIRAFTQAYQVDVTIFKYDDQVLHIKAEHDDVRRPVAYIALHDYEHYSSIRKIDGPSTGLPEIDIKENSQITSAPIARGKARKGPIIQPWMFDVVKNSIAYPVDDDVIRQSIWDNNGNIDNAVSQLLEEYSSVPGTPGTLSESGYSSIERDHASEDDEAHGPNKRRVVPKAESTNRSKKDQRARAGKTIPTVEVSKVGNEYASTSECESASRGDGASTPASSRSQSVALTTSTQPKVRIILRTKSQIEKLERQQSRSQSPRPPPSPQSSQPMTEVARDKPKKKLVSARELKEQKKAAQKKASKERKREKSSQPDSSSKSAQENKSPNGKRPSPPMEKVLNLDTLKMITC